MTAEIVRELVDGEWVTTVGLSGGGGGSQNLAQVLAQGNDGNGSTIENLAEGVNPSDAATVSQIGGGGTQDLASVLAAGGDPDGNPITGPTLIDTAGVQGAQTFTASTDYNGAGLGLYLNDSGGETQILMYGHIVQLADENFTPMLEVNGGLNLMADLNGSSTYRIKALLPGVDPGDAATVSQLLGPDNVYLIVDSNPPSTYVAPLVYDTTAVTGGLYAWNGGAYVKVGNVVA